MAIDKEKIEYHIGEILKALGDDPNREGLVDTPKRVANMYSEVFKGMEYTNEEIAKEIGVTFENDSYTKGHNKDMVVVRDIEIFSFCEHHMALMYNMKVSIGYIPGERILGLSKMARIADLVGKRLQLQERIGKDIAEVMELASGVEDIAVHISGDHSCMTSRGIGKVGATTETVTLRGRFEREIDLQRIFLERLR